MPTKTPSSVRIKPKPTVVSRLARAALVDLITPYGIQASNWELFRGAVFGRDSEIVAQDVDRILPEIFSQVMMSLIKYQGDKTDTKSGEEPGRTFHELRFQHVGGPKQHEIFRELSARNGIGQNGVYVDYGTVDASPQLIRTVAEHVGHFGPEVLKRTIPHDGTELTIGEAVRLSAAWVSDRIDRSDLGLLERLPESGTAGNSQTLRDGAVSYLHENGRLADLTQPMASIEVQGLAYDALLQAASLVGTKDEKAKWRRKAERLRLRTFKYFWMPERRNWAMAIDRDATGQPRQLATVTSLPAELLETGIFENMPTGYDRQVLIAPLVNTVFSPDILTAVGPRMRSLRYAHLLPYADYQGSWSVWPVNANSIAKGLHRYGFHSLERDLTLRILAGTVGVAGIFPEFMLVDMKGDVCWPLFKDGAKDDVMDTLLATNFPELGHAWTVSAALRIAEEPCRHKDPHDWRGVLAEEIRQQLLSHPSAVRLHPYRLDRRAAVVLEKKVISARSARPALYSQATHAIL